MEIFAFFGWLIRKIISVLSINIPYIDVSLWSIMLGLLIVGLVISAIHWLFGGK